jgi:hypothetical protein
MAHTAVLKIFILGTGYIGGYFIGSIILRFILLKIDLSIKSDTNPEVRKAGRWIGACEH